MINLYFREISTFPLASRGLGSKKPKIKIKNQEVYQQTGKYYLKNFIINYKFNILLKFFYKFF